MSLRVRVRRKAFDEKAVLEGLEFDLGEREIVALVGPSGCGKTTLLKIIGGLDADYDGTIDWPGIRSPRIGTIFQEPRLLPWRTVRQNLTLVLPPDTHAAAEELLRHLGLWPFRDHFPPTLSLGMARRVAIARAFAIAPELVLLDEPFVSLDPEMAQRSREVLLEAWRERATSVLLVTHDPVGAAALADRILVLSARPAHIVAEIEVPAAQRRGERAAALQVAAQLEIAVEQHRVRG
jgi:ABC-type nitrate/sulfonate/bicarbonate transport system ATPase subunit